MKGHSPRTEEAAARWMRVRLNPWKDMTPEKLARAFDEFDAGWIRQASLMWENRAERDEVLASVVPKRCASVARLPWAILPVDDSPEAERHVEALQDFFDRVDVTDALDLDQRGGMRLLIEQQMEAVFTRKAVHEIIWRPGRNDLAAELRRAPLYFFEQISGRLRYIGPELTTQGEELEPGGWMITTRARLLMKACLMCVLFKSLSLSDWIGYSATFGQPGLHVEIDAAPETKEWEAAEAAAAAFAAEWRAVTRKGVDFNLIETGKNPNAPYEPMVERMSRLLTVLCRGADLGTLSSQDGAGASLQGDESDLLLDDDAQMVSEALQRSLARPVIRHLFGTDKPLAYIEVQVPADTDTNAEIAVDDALQRWGIEQEPADVAERYGRTISLEKDSDEEDGTRADENSDAEEEVDDETALQDAMENDRAADDPAFDGMVMRQLGDLLTRAVSGPMRMRLYRDLRALLVSVDDGDLMAALDQLRDRLPDYLGDSPDAVREFERFTAAALLAGWGENTTTQSQA